MLEDRYLTDEQKGELCHKYLHHSFPDKVIEEATHKASDYTLEVVVKWLGEHNVAEMCSDLQGIDTLWVLQDDWQELRRLVK